MELPKLAYIHYRMKQLIIPLLLLAQIAFGQQHEIDSLRGALDHAITDTQKVIILSKLGFSFGFVNYDSSVMYNGKALKLAQDKNYLYGQFVAYDNQFHTYNVIADYTNALRVSVAALGLAKQ